MFRKLMTSIERRVYGSDFFSTHARATRALLKFCDDHDNTVAAVQDLRTCLAAWEAGEKTNAVEALKGFLMRRDGLGGWFPPAVSPMETKEYSWAVFEALVERW